MPRKTLAVIDPKLTEAIEEFRSLSLVRNEMALDLCELQDDTTAKVIDGIVSTLRKSANGYVTLRVAGKAVQVKLDDEYLGYNLFWLATEVVKDLGFVGIKVANFEFAPNLCASCGDEV